MKFADSSDTWRLGSFIGSSGLVASALGVPESGRVGGLRKAGKGASEIAEALGVGQASVYRMLKDQAA